MIDLGTDEGRIVAAALRLAADKPWQEVTLRQIADASGMSLVALSEHFASKTEIVAAFVRCVDRDVLQRAPGPREGESKRDALFEVVMARFDALEPHKSALRSMVESGELEIPMLKPLFKSQSWMLQAAGIDSSGPAGAVRTAGMASVYASVLRTWLDDGDPGLARTMAALDRRLRNGESVMSGMDSVIGAARRVKEMLRSGVSSARSRQGDGRRDDDPPNAGADASPSAT